MLLRPFLNDAGSCASYLFGCTSHNKLAIVDPHADLVDEYVAAAAAIGAPITAVFETHVQADHVSGLPALVERTGATAYVPSGAGVEFEHVALAGGEVVELGNTIVTAIATPGHAPAHHAYTVADRRRVGPGPGPSRRLPTTAWSTSNPTSPSTSPAGSLSPRSLSRTAGSTKSCSCRRLTSSTSASRCG